jgi:hypothetical protein
VVLPLGPDAVLHQTERLHGAVHETVFRLAVEEDLGRLRLGRGGAMGRKVKGRSDGEDGKEEREGARSGG